MASVVTSGWSAAASRLARLPAELDAAAKQIAIESAAVIEAAAKRNFEGSHARGKPHVGGNKPNVVTGNLRRSIEHTPVTSKGPGAWGTTVGPTSVYGRRVELGSSTSRAFPFFTPAVTGTEMQLLAIALTNWARVLR